VVVTKTGKFNENLIDVDFNLLISKGNELSSSTIDQLTKLNYQIVVHDINFWLINLREL